MKRLPTARDRRAEEIVDHLESRFFSGLCGGPISTCHFDWDHDEARKLIALLIPQTAAEYEEEMDEALKNLVTSGVVKQPNPNSPMNRLRLAVHATPEMSFKTVIEAAIEMINRSGKP